MKRILIWLLILAMALSFPVTVFADPATQTVYGQVLESVDLIPGRTFTYEISIRDNLGFITGATTITWPAADFELKAVEFGLNLEDNGSMTPGTNVNGTYTAVFGKDTATQNTTDNGVLLTLTFEILESATAGTKAINLTFGRDEDDFIAFDPIATPSVPTAFESGSVTLTEVHQTVYGEVIDLQNLIPGETFTYDVGIRDNLGIVTGACKLSWSKDDFELIGVTLGTGMPDNGSQPITEAADGDYIVSFGSDTMTADYTGNGTLFTLTFKILPTATAGKKDIGITFGYDEDDFLNFGRYRMPTAFEPGSVTLKAINQTVYGAVIEKGLSPGKTFTYDVSIRDNVGIATGAVKVEWPEEDFELTGITFVGMVNNDTPDVSTAANGEFIVTFGNDTATTDYTDNGVLFTLTFTIAEHASLGLKNITLSYGIDEDDFMNAKGITIPTALESGSVTLIEHTHELVKTNRIEPTCSSIGTEEYWTCSVCGLLFSDAEGSNEISAPVEIAKLPHTPGEPVTENVVPATPSSNGHYDEVIYCVVCEEELSRETKDLVYSGQTVSGTVISFGSATNETTVSLKQGNVVINTNVVIGNNSTYSFEAIEAGSYTLEISKLNHVTRLYDIVVDSSDVTTDVKICLLGDVTGDGRVNITDVNRLYNHVRKVDSITDEYLLSCGNAVPDVRINITDVNRLLDHVKKINPLY